MSKSNAAVAGTKPAREPKVRKVRIPYERKKQWAGFLFLSPWLFGIIFIFIKPLIESLYYSFVRISYDKGGVRFDPVGIYHYRELFVGNADFIQKLTTSVQNMIYQVPIIVIFSLFIAIILNQKFFGRVFVRATFFLPVIIASGVVISIMKEDYLQQVLRSSTSINRLFSTTFLTMLLNEANVPWDLRNLITQTVDSMFELIWKSGIQILIFLAGLQTIHVSQYEAAKIEGATGWEVFWKITFPMISPITILNVVYTIIDSFRDYSNPVINLIATNIKQLHLEYSLAMSWTYFSIVALIIAVVYVIADRYVFYQV